MSGRLLCFRILNFEHQFYKRKQQFIYRRKIDYSSLFHFYDSLQNKDLMGRLQLDVANLNVNYNILENILVQTFNECIPVRKIKLHKHKHKRSEWITMGLIRSIKYRDNLYKRLKKVSQTSNEFYEMKQNLRVYNRILKRSIREAKALYYKNKFNQFKGDSKKTWSTKNDIIKRSDSKQLLPDY